MAFCSHCGSQMADNSRFCPECGAAVKQKDGNSSERKIVYDGEIHKCPHCGAVLPSFQMKCPECGFELRAVKTSSVVQEFANKLEEIENQRDSTRDKIVNSITGTLTKTDEKKINLISSFPIPNTKEDLFEFLVLASSNINKDRYYMFAKLSESQKAMSDAWLAKFDQAYQKAKIGFSDSLDFEKIKNVHTSITVSLKQSRRRNVTVLVAYFAVFFLLLGILGSMALVSSKKTEEENNRLNAIVEEVYSYMDEGNYDMARLKVSSLVYTGTTSSSEGKQACKKWDILREEMMETIDNAEKGGK